MLDDDHKHVLEWTIGANDILCTSDCDFYLHRIEIMKTIETLEKFFINWEIKDVDDLCDNIIMNEDLVKDLFKIIHPKGR